MTREGGWRWLQVLGSMGLLMILAVIVIPNPLDWGRYSPEEAAQRNCFANQRVVVGAVEMYQEANPKKPFTKFDQTIFPELLSTGILKTMEPMFCYQVNRQRIRIFLLEKFLSVFSPVLIPVEGQFEGEFLPGSTTLKLRCRNHGSPK